MKKLFVFLIFVFASLVLTPKIRASQPALGIHLLDPNELSLAIDLVEGDEEHPGSVTVVLRADDRDSEKWKTFFTIAQQNNVKPIIRLATEMTKDGWRRPTKRDIVEHAAFLTNLNWHSQSLLIIAFNEPNHAAEWDGEVDPESYAQMLEFTLSWFHTEKKQYRVLPAGLDAAAPNGPETMDSFVFLRRVLAHSPELVEMIDGWVTHAYPNPGFVASPRETGKRSIQGFQNELQLLSQYTDREFSIYITETGWKKTAQNADKIADYYSYAVNKVWNDERIKAITPFVFAAHSGPFQDFSFTDKDGSPTPQYRAWKSLKRIRKQNPSLQFLTSIQQILSNL
ncbi:hypothetical protein IH980_00660 [Patescibacteria group bacterium]|nr:hypothetical protein [Patescibacteria group bacterium]